MILYYINGSQQRKKLVESEYVEDVYDVIEEFFDEHGYRPHFIKNEFEPEWKITFGSYSEYFLVADYDEEDVIEAKHMWKL